MSCRWKKKRKERVPETKPRKKRTAETKPRKQRVVKYVPICGPHDPISLAGMRKTCSPALRRTRLLDFSQEELEAYADCAGINVRTARRDRGPIDHKGHLDAKERKLVLAKWAELVTEKAGTECEHSECTQAKFREQLEVKYGILLSRHQFQRLRDAHGVTKTPGPERTHYNCPDAAEAQRLNGLAARL